MLRFRLGGNSYGAFFVALFGINSIITVKHFFLSVLLLSFCLTSFARDWRSDKGYSGSIAIGASVGTDILVSDNLILYGCETNHGFAFGNGWYFGGGVGIDYLSEKSIYVPLYTEARYAIPDSFLYVFGRIGTQFSKGFGLRPMPLSEGGSGCVFGNWSLALSVRTVSYTMLRSEAIPLASLRLKVAFNF